VPADTRSSRSLDGQLAVVTGAGSGIGAAIAAGLASEGATLCLVGRDKNKLLATSERVAATGATAECFAGDLGKDQDILDLTRTIGRHHDRVDILVHAAGTITLGSIEAATIDDFDRQYRINVRAPVLLTKMLLPLIKQAQGQIVFVNSSVGRRVKEQVGAYAASKHALRAVADTLRLEINSHGVRVLSVYPGNTATAMQDTVQNFTGRRIAAEYLLQPEDVASAVVNALLLPRTAEVTDIEIRPLRKLST
jgi:NADP-dependent 3-hydroxy acid dehydrogenase YdfG